MSVTIGRFVVEHLGMTTEQGRRVHLYYVEHRTQDWRETVQIASASPTEAIQKALHIRTRRELRQRRVWERHLRHLLGQPDIGDSQRFHPGLAQEQNRDQAEDREQDQDVHGDDPGAA